MAKIIIWDNDGTITSSKNPNDKARVILPGVREAMQSAEFNFIISGYKSPESEAQNFDPVAVADNFVKLMGQLPVNAAAFSPTIGGIACYVVIRKPNNSFEIKKTHEDPRYKKYIGQFKKPDIGMFMVIKDIACEVFGQIIDNGSCIMIGDSWHDEAASKKFGIPFIEARVIHERALF